MARVLCLGVESSKSKDALYQDMVQIPVAHINGKTLSFVVTTKEGGKSIA